MSGPRQDIYSRAALRALLEAQSIAIIGASEKPQSFGARTRAHLDRFDGRIHLVNPSRDFIGDERCFHDVASLPETPDVAMLTIPRHAVEQAVLDCAAHGVPGVIIGASGYAETGLPERRELQDRLVAISHETGLRIIGPNCLGVVNYLNKQLLTFATVPPEAGRDKRIAIVSQSGALGCALAQSAERGVAISHVLTSGNSCDVDMADYVSYLAEDPDVDAIACLFEGMSTPGRMLLAAAKAVELDTPLIMHKIATGSEGAAAALSHTGSLAGSEKTYRAAFDQAGIISVDRYEALIETAAFFAKAPVPTARGSVIVATSGGAAIMAADAAEARELPLPQPEPQTKQLLEKFIPEFGSSRNPCDVTAQVASDPKSLFKCTEALLGEEQFGAMVVPHPYAYDLSTPRIKALGEIGARHGKPICLVWLTENLQGPGAIEAEQRSDVMLFRSMERCFDTLAAWHKHARFLENREERSERVSSSGATQIAAGVIEQSSDAVLTESIAKKLLSAYGIEVVEEKLVQSADEAEAVTANFGKAVALKAESSAIPHKTEAGVIRLNVNGGAAVKTAFEEIWDAALLATTKENIRGVLVQPMVPEGVEMIVGARSDPLFGPTVMVGMGGILVELTADSALAVAPVSKTQARAMIKSLRGAALLKGFRGMPAADIDRVAEAICRISELIADHGERIAEIDVNPLVCTGEDCVAVDALIVLNKGTNS